MLVVPLQWRAAACYRQIHETYLHTIHSVPTIHLSIAKRAPSGCLSRVLMKNERSLRYSHSMFVCCRRAARKSCIQTIARASCAGAHQIAISHSHFRGITFVRYACLSLVGRRAEHYRLKFAEGINILSPLANNLTNMHLKVIFAHLENNCASNVNRH